MKKKIIIGSFTAMLLAVGFALAPAAPAFAADPVLGISGVVTDYDTGQPVGGAIILVYCDGVLVLDSATEDDGSYDVPPNSNCQVGGTLTVTVTKDDKSDSSTSTLKDINTVDLRLKTTIHIPEYGLVSGILAGSLAIGATLFIRSRNASV